MQEKDVNAMENEIHVGEEQGTNESNIAEKAHSIYDTKSMKEKLDDLRNEIKDQKALEHSHYEEEKFKYDTIYTIKNKKTKKIVELVAPSAVAAANFIGWRVRHTVMLGERKLEVVQQETTQVEKKD